MALKAALSPVILTATQGSADAFVQASVATGITGRQAYNARSISFEITNMATLSGVSSGDFEIQMALCRRSKTAIPTTADVDVIAKHSLAFVFTTSGAVIVPGIVTLYPDVEVPIVEDTLYLAVDSTNTGIANTIVCRIESELDTMSDLDRLNLITRSLS